MALRLLRRIQAARDVEEIADFIAQDSLGSAVRFLENAEATLRRLTWCEFYTALEMLRPNYDAFDRTRQLLSDYNYRRNSDDGRAVASGQFSFDE